MRFGERRTAVPPLAVHIVYRSGWGTYDIYGDGTIDARMGEHAGETLRYYVPRGDIKALTARLSQLNIWAAPPIMRIEDGFITNADLAFDGKSAKQLSLTREVIEALKKVTREVSLKDDLALRLQLLEANGFHFYSPEGADLAVSIAMTKGYSAGDIAALLRHDVPCSGGMHAEWLGLGSGPSKRVDLRDALIAGGYADLASHLDALPAARPLTGAPALPVQPLQWLKFATLDDMTDFYPKRANDDEVEGIVTISCRMAAHGRLTNCQIVSETPKGYGFGDAAGKLLEKRLKAKQGTFVAGQELRATVKWQL